LLQYQNSLKKRKEYLSVICKQHKTWPIRIALYIILNVVTITIIAGVLLLLVEHPLDAFGSFTFLAGAICFACVPFFCAISVKNSAKYKCASPYSGMTNGKLLLTDECLEFVFWKASKEAPAAYSSKRAVYREEDSFVYTIHSSQIKSLKIDKNHICHISGVGIVSQPEWAGTKDVREEIETKSFSFLLDFEDSSVEKNLEAWANNLLDRFEIEK